MFSSSAFKVSFLTVHITDPFEMIFDERNDVELPFYFILFYTWKTSQESQIHSLNNLSFSHRFKMETFS